MLVSFRVMLTVSRSLCRPRPDCTPASAVGVAVCRPLSTRHGGGAVVQAAGGGSDASPGSKTGMLIVLKQTASTWGCGVGENKNKGKTNTPVHRIAARSTTRRARNRGGPPRASPARTRAPPRDVSWRRQRPRHAGRAAVARAPGRWQTGRRVCRPAARARAGDGVLWYVGSGVPAVEQGERGGGGGRGTVTPLGKGRNTDPLPNQHPRLSSPRSTYMPPF